MSLVKSAAAASEATASDENLYPSIESFLERARPEDVEALFKDIKSGLTALKGPRTDYAPRIDLALERARELMRHLLQVREGLEEGTPNAR